MSVAQIGADELCRLDLLRGQTQSCGTVDLRDLVLKRRLRAASSEHCGHFHSGPLGAKWPAGER